MGDDFGIGLGGEGVPFRLELLFQGLVVLDDAVVGYHRLTAAVGMRMRVALGGGSVGRPACVSNGNVPAEGAVLASEQRGQSLELAGGASDGDFGVAGEHG